jgi:hypothetical protein
MAVVTGALLLARPQPVAAEHGGPPTQKPASRAPVVHILALRDSSKILRVVFSSAILDLAHHRAEHDI